MDREARATAAVAAVSAPEGLPGPDPLVPSGSRRAGLARMARGAGWSVVDQALSSLSNLTLSILVARAVDAHAFGAFTVSFTVYSMAVLVSRALVTQPLAVRFSGARREVFQVAAGMSAGAAVVMGVALGSVVLVCGLLIGGSVGLALSAVAVCLPGLLLQDACRMVFFAEGRPKLAALVDALWMVLQLVGVGAVVVTDARSAVPYVVAWGVASAVAATTGVVRGGLRPRVWDTRTWLRDHWSLTRYLVLDAVLVQSSYQGTLLVVGALGSLTGVASLRGAQVLIGPISMLAMAAMAFGVPQISRRVHLTGGQRMRLSFVVSAVFTVMGVVWAAVLLLLPDGAGEALLGDSWSGVDDVLVPTLAGAVANLLAIGPTLMIYAMGRSATALRINGALSALLVGCGLTGLWLGDAVGVAWGLTLAYWLVMPWWYIALRRARLESAPAPASAAL
ncbi:hypothetical protein [Trujillonella endophytica]|uniref:hypothetical protein n=1 Tax=Trujillonella endophytica TaxID=673521 RepID=UPI000B836AD5|nr:hypothetical protein [Trujillella endophytica]